MNTLRQAGLACFEVLLSAGGIVVSIVLLPCPFFSDTLPTLAHPSTVLLPALMIVKLALVGVFACRCPGLVANPFDPLLVLLSKTRLPSAAWWRPR